MEDADVRDVQDVVKRVAATHVRHPLWREDAEQEAWLGIVRAASRHGRVSEHLAAHITVNASRYVCRSHMHEGLSMADPSVLFSGVGVEDPGLEIDLEEWLLEQLVTRRRVLEHVLEGKNYGTFRDLAKKTQTSLATVSRAMGDLEQWLKNRLAEQILTSSSMNCGETAGFHEDM